MRKVPDRMTRTRISAEALCDERVVARAYAGQGVRPAMLRAICMAAQRLGLPLPHGAANHIPPTGRAA